MTTVYPVPEPTPPLTERLKRITPNALTILRLILFPVPFILLFINPISVMMRLITTAVFVIIILTDMADGRFARRWNVVSDFGKFWDPLADKFFMIATLLGLCLFGLFPAPWGWIYLGYTFVRELGVTIWRVIRAPHVVIPADWWGKMKTFTLAIAVGMMLLPVDAWIGGILLILWWVVIIALLIASLIGSLVSGSHYIRQ